MRDGRRVVEVEPHEPRQARSRRIGNCSGFYGDRLSAMREMLEGGAARRPDRRLPRRADHADPRQGHDEGRLARLRPHLRPAGRGLPRARARARREDRRNAGGLNPAGLADRLREVAKGLGLDAGVAHVEGDDLRPRAGAGLGGRADRQRLPRRLRHRRGAAWRRRRRGHRPGHRRLAGRRPGGRPLRLEHHGVRRARRRGRRRARPRVRHPGHRRQLLRLPQPARTTAARWASRSPRSPPTAPA